MAHQTESLLAFLRKAVVHSYMHLHIAAFSGRLIGADELPVGVAMEIFTWRPDPDIAGVQSAAVIAQKSDGGPLSRRAGPSGSHETSSRKIATRIGHVRPSGRMTG